jgi:hypothetical protein
MPVIEIPILIPHSDADQERLRKMDEDGTLASPENGGVGDDSPEGISVVPRGAEFDPSQPRDDRGMWTSDGSAAPPHEELVVAAKHFSQTLGGGATLAVASTVVIQHPEDFKDRWIADRREEFPNSPPEQVLVNATAQAEHAATLVNAIRHAPEEDTTMFRGVSFYRGDGHDDLRSKLAALKGGDTLTLDRLSAFTENRAQAAFYAGSSRSGALASYELVVEGPSKSVATDVLTGMGHQERITQGRFEVVRVEPASKVRLPKEYTGRANYKGTIVLRHVGVF